MTRDAREPEIVFRLAVPLLWGLGFFFVVGGAAALLLAVRARFGPYVPAWVPLFFLAMILSLSAFPGVAYLALAPFVRRRRSWALIAAVSLAMAHAALSGTVAIALAMRGRVLEPIICGLGAFVLIALALVLVRAYFSMRTLLRHGFQPILPATPVAPLDHGHEYMPMPRPEQSPD